MEKAISINRPWGVLSSDWGGQVGEGKSIEVVGEAGDDAGVPCYFGVPASGLRVVAQRCARCHREVSFRFGSAGAISSSACRALRARG